MSQLRVSSVATVSGDEKIDLSIMSSSGYYLRKVVVDVDTTNRSFGTSWTDMYTSSTYTDFKANSIIIFSYSIPFRNDDTGWGGAYVEPFISFNNGSNWYSLGSSGYDGNVMRNGAAEIATYGRELIINPSLAGITSDFSIKIKFYCKTYSGSCSWNDSHDLTARSGFASDLPGLNNANQHYANFNIKELARMQ